MRAGKPRRQQIGKIGVVFDHHQTLRQHAHGDHGLGYDPSAGTQFENLARQDRVDLGCDSPCQGRARRRDRTHAARVGDHTAQKPQFVLKAWRTR